MSTIGAVGIDHRAAGVRPLGFAWLSSDRLERALGPLAEAGRVDELLLISAAGGIEAYFTSRHPHAAAGPLSEAMIALVGTPGAAVRPRDRLVCRLGADAVRRLFRIVAGLEALVPGDEEVRRALRAAERAGTAGPVLRQLCAEAQRSARRARQCGGLGAGPVQLARLVDDTARRFDAALAATFRPGRPGRRFEVIDGQATRLDVLVRRLVSPLDTGSIHGRGHGILQRDPGVEVTFLLDQAEFVSLRDRMLRRDGEVRFSVAMNDVTAIDAARSRPALV